MRLGGAIGTLEAGAFGKAVEGFLGDDVATGEHHGGIRLCGLLFGDGADEDGVEVVGGGEGDFDGELVLGGPLCARFLHDVLELEEVRESDGTGCGGDVEWGVGGETEERAELSGKGSGYLLPGSVVVKVFPKGRVDDILPECHGAYKLLYLVCISPLEVCKFAAGIFIRGRQSLRAVVHGLVVVGVAVLGKEQTDILQPAQFELQIAPLGFQHLTAFPCPLDGGLEVSLLAQLVQYVVHFPKLGLELLGTEVTLGKVGFPRVVVHGRVGRAGRGLGARGVAVRFLDEGGSDVELSFPEEVHGDCPVDELRVRREGIVGGGRNRLVLELLWRVSVDDNKGWARCNTPCPAPSRICSGRSIWA